LSPCNDPDLSIWIVRKLEILGLTHIMKADNLEHRLRCSLQINVMKRSENIDTFEMNYEEIISDLKSLESLKKNQVRK
jgi:hypothetical protein